MEGSSELNPGLVKAIYSKPRNVDYIGNPLIEALPPPMSEKQVLRYLAYWTKVTFSKNERKHPAYERIQYVFRLNEFFMPFERHIPLECTLSTAIRRGYLSRNLRSPDMASACQKFYESLHAGKVAEPPKIFIMPSMGFTVIGPAGTGKSKVFEVLLWLYRPILHTVYKGEPFVRMQVPSLIISCAHDGSIEQLCTNFFEKIDGLLKTNYKKEYIKTNMTKNRLLTNMKVVAEQHFLGVLVVDEIQNLSPQKSGGAPGILRFFAQMADTLKVPIVFVGTPQALPLLQGCLATARRADGIRDFIWDVLNKDEWDDFIDEIWAYQWTRTPTKLDDCLKQLIFDESQGIIDIAVRIIVLAQCEAIAQGGEELITPEIIKKVVAEHLTIIQPLILALKLNDITMISKKGDLRLPKLIDYKAEYERRLATIRGRPVQKEKYDPPVNYDRKLSEVNLVGERKVRDSKKAWYLEGDLRLIHSAASAASIPVSDKLRESGVVRDPVSEWLEGNIVTC